MAIPISNRNKIILVRRVIGFGESLIDFVIEDEQFKHALPGGSVLNTLVSLSRFGANTQLVTDFSDDAPGRIISRFLQEENIGSDYLSIYKEGKTALAFAALDSNKNASYTFYKDYPEKRFEDLRIAFSSNDIFLFGSFSSLQINLQIALNNLINDAKSAGSLIFYDPNIRMHKISETKPEWKFLMRNFAVADIIRGSDEDFQTIFGTDSAVEIFDKIQPSSCKLLIITSSDSKVAVVSNGFSFQMSVPSVKVVSTIGAGDAFNAGMVASIIEQEISKDQLEFLSEQQTKLILKKAIAFASEVCASSSNYISKQLTV
ncbi:MAG: carbohydrate kinase [Bacteroidales bacterium]|nr:carbohydrate kinase [Bacteroidales bacterium]